MTNNELVLVSVLGGFGIIVGSVIGTITAKKNVEIGVALVLAPVVATVFLLAFCFVITALDAMQKHGYNVAKALHAGIGALFFLVFSLPFVTGIPALIAAFVTHVFVKKRNANRVAEQIGADRPLSR